MEKQFLPKTDFPFKSYDKKLVFMQRMDSVCSCLAQGNFYLFFNFKCYNLTIRAVNFCETFCICFPSSQGQDLTVKNSNFYFYFFCSGFLS
jgi:hypothetical protein